MITIANAPVSYGVFGLAKPELVELPTGDALLDLVQQAGYDGVDLGAHGLFGTGEDLLDNLERRGLGLAGGWVDYPFAGEDAEFEAAFEAAKPVLDDFALVASQQSGHRPLPTIADAGDAVRKAHPGGTPELQLTGERWARFVARVERVAEHARALGLEPTFHHHAVTYIETPSEIDAFLRDTTMDLTFDTGHLLLGGGDPTADLKRWAGRINHLHLKDVDLGILEAAKGSDDPLRDVWEKRVFVALGEGDLDLDGIVGDIVASGFDGWLVVEQDIVLMNQADLDRAVADQIANREAIRRWFA